MKNVNRSFYLFMILLLSLAPAGACQGQEPEAKTEMSPAQIRSARSFGDLVDRLSGEAGYFDTDNLISNESSYLHAISTLQKLDLRGGAYIGVGPDQNFSYIAHLRPEVAIILDIRRDNLLLHTLYKVLFELSDDRVDFLEHLFARKPESGTLQGWPAWDIVEIMDVIEASPRLKDAERASLQLRVIEKVKETGLELSDRDLQKIRAIHDEFIVKGPSLRFTSHGRPPQSYYPTYRELILEKDRSGRQVSFLSLEEHFQYIKEMHESDRIVPVVGSFADEHALKEIGDFLREIDEEVVAFYTSNVEYYLMYQQQFRLFVENVERLPVKENAVIIRSYFNRFRMAHPETLPGYASTQLVQYIRSLTGRTPASYGDLVSDYVR